MLDRLLDQARNDLQELLPTLRGHAPALQKLCDALLGCWKRRGKVLLAGNGGSMADAVHFAEELTVRYKKNRRALAAVALSDAAAITCAGNDFGYDTVFSRQVEALGNEGDVLIVFTTSGNSPSILAALEAARRQRLVTCAFLGKDGGRARGQADIELLIAHAATARIQEMHQVLFHVACEWVDAQFPEEKK
jgi:D-sedoheptulose 7-phosphate isomerase